MPTTDEKQHYLPMMLSLRAKTILLTTELLCIATTGMSYNLRSITSKDGLSNSSILSFGKMYTGMMLFGTCDGVNCFDGTRVYQLPAMKGAYVEGNIIEWMVVDRDNCGWILTNHGLSRILRTQKHVNMPRFQSARGIRLNADNRVIVLQDNNLYAHTGRDTTFVRLPLSGGDNGDQTLDFFMTDNNLFLFKTNGIVRYNLQHQGDKYTLGKRTVLSSEQLLAASCDENREYLVDSEGTLWAFDFASANRRSIASLQEDIARRGAISRILSMNNRFFVSFLNSGVLILEKQGDLYRKSDLGIQVGVTAMYHDPTSDIIWIGTDGQGVLMFIDELEMRRSLTTDVMHLLQRKPYRAILLDSDGTLWAGTKGDGLLEIPDFNLVDIHNNLQRRFLRRENTGLAGNSVFALLPSRRLKGFWVATNNGISFRSRTNQNIVTVPTEMPVEWVSALCERGDTLWMTTQGMGVYRAIIGGTEGQPRLTDMKRYVLDGGKKTSNYFFSMASVPGGPLYLGNRGKGLFVLQNDQLTWVKPVVQLPNDAGLEDIFAVLPTREGLWIGTGVGLSFRPNRGEKDVEFYDVSHGMPNNVIHALTEDAEGNVWASTNKGLVRFAHGTHRMRLFNEADNLEVNEYADGAVFSIGDTLFFGGYNGISIIVADKAANDRRHDIRPTFTGLSILGMPAFLDDYLQIDGDKQTLTLNYDQNTLKLHVTTFDFFDPGAKEFFYSFSENGPWISSGHSGEINLTRLSSGSHTLYVKCRDLLSGEDSKPVLLTIRITPPWYLSWWAKLLYLCTVLAILYFLYHRWNLHRQVKAQIMEARREQEQRDQMYEQKMHFLTNLVHELNTPLTLVYGPCERILSHTGTDNFVRRYVSMIQSNMKRLNQLIQEIMDIRRLNAGKEKVQLRSMAVGEFLWENLRSFKELAEQNNITLECEVDKDLVWNSDDRLLRRISMNIISNAFKYSKQGAVIRVRLGKDENGQLLFSVYNTGSGIPENERQHIFDYYTMFDSVDESATLGFTSRNGLGMAICAETVKLLEGTIEIDSVEGEYACFIVRLPWMELPEGTDATTLRPSFVDMKETGATSVAADASDIHGAQTDVLPSTPAASVMPRRPRQSRVHREGIPTVLVIDDNKQILELIDDMLGDDYNVMKAESGEQGMEIIKQKMPDLIVTDLMMSGMDGLELTQRLKQNKHTMHIPIIILSARCTVKEQVEGLDSGADAYVSKPFSAQYLQAVVARLIENCKVLKEYYNTSASSFTFQDGKLMAGEERKFRDEVISIINKNLTNADFTPNDLASKMNLSQRKLYRKFSEAGLPTPKEFIKSYRIEYAARQLDTTNLTIQEIIYSSGFNTRTQFYAEFRKHYGITPKEYREQRRVKDNSLE